MVKFAGGLDEFLAKNYPEEFVLISFGHTELFTDKIQEEYLDWYENVYLKRSESNVEEEN